MEEFAPRPTGAPERAIDLETCLIPWKDGQPAMLHAAQSPNYYLVLFTSLDQLADEMASVNAPYDSVKEITDHQEFLDSIPLKFNGKPLKVIVDMRSMPDGTIRWTEIQRTED